MASLIVAIKRYELKICKNWTLFLKKQKQSYLETYYESY